jgi:hypothetical protein
VRMFERIATITRPNRTESPGGGEPGDRNRDDRDRRYGPGVVRTLAAGLLGVAAAVLVSCGGSGKGLIPLANAGPLQSDFDAIAQAAQTGNGDCTATTAAINKTEQDFAALPITIDPGLHNRLSQGISNLRERALALCEQPLVPTTATSPPRRTTTTTTTKTESAPTTPTPAPSPSTSTTPTTPNTPTTPSTGGGTAAPGNESAPGGGTGVGESGGAGIGAGGEESGK